MVAQVGSAVACLTLVSIPFLAVDVVPSTDLPQHFGQLRLLEAYLESPDSGLALQWWTPYWLVYALLALPWLLLPPLPAAWTGALLLALGQVAAIHLLAAAERRPPSAAVLAAAFTFNQLFYWGFVNFLFGWLVFVGWFLISRRSPPPDESRWREPLMFGGASMLLFFSHALWFGVAILWLPLEGWLSRREPRRIGWRLLGTAPALVGAAIWFFAVRGSSFATGAEWGLQQFGRLDPRWLLLGALGGIRHPIELAVLGGAAVWIVLGLIAGRRRRWLGCDRHLALLALLFLVLYLVLPNKYVNTIRLSSRWLPFFVVTALLAVPRPPLGRIGRGVTAGVLLSLLAVTTTVAWQAVERDELSGLDEALAALPDRPRRVLGLSYLTSSRYLWVAPFKQTFAWAQVARGGELSFSFGYFATSPVVYRDLDRVVWTRNLDNFPELLQPGDLQHFDYALVGGDAAAHGRFGGRTGAEPVTRGLPWRLYRVGALSGKSEIVERGGRRTDDGP